MIERAENLVSIQHPEYGWEAVHATDRFGGPLRLTAGAGVLLEGTRTYVDDLDDSSILVTSTRAFRKGGAAVVVSSGYLPFGGEATFRQTCRYAANHVRVTLDIGWPRGGLVRRHLGVGGHWLPGPWRRVFCVPPASHLADGAEPAWHSIPAAPTDAHMVAHWHRPPLALVFERADGTRLELGTGSDLWRWEQSLGYGPECGSYKVIACAEGVRVVREPLMCCREFSPTPRPYRLSWYAAWSLPGDAGRTVVGAKATQVGFAAGQPSLPSLRTASSAAQVRGERSPCACWLASATSRAARRTIRSLSAQGSGGELAASGLTPGICWDAAHLGRRVPDGLVHWDINALLDFSVWARQQLGPAWRVVPRADGSWAELPSVCGLFAQNGFADAEAP